MGVRQDWPQPKHPRDCSVDVWLLAASHLTNMVLFATSRFLTLPGQMIAEVVLVLTVLGIGVVYRVKRGWRWPGIGVWNVVAAVVAVVFGGIFFGVSLTRVPLLTPGLLSGMRGDSS